MDVNLRAARSFRNDFHVVCYSHGIPLVALLDALGFTAVSLLDDLLCSAP